jgi:hypothetical protein
MRRGRIILFILLGAAPLFALSDQSAQDGQNSVTVPSSRGISAPGPRPAELESRVEGKVPPETPVVILDGPCKQPRNGVQQSTCKSVVTRAEVDSVVDVLEPNASPADRRQLAINYARLAAASAAASRRHLEKDPLIAKQLQMQQKLVYMQVLADAFYRELEAEAKNVPISEIEKYYSGHQVDFDRGEVRRLFVPKPIPTPPSQSVAASKLKAEAEELRARAVAGEDFDKLQKTAYDDLGIKAPVTTKLSMARRTSLPAGEDVVFDLDPGQVTQVLDSRTGFVVLKLESRKILSLEDATPEILPFLQRERAQQVIQNTTESGKAEFNLQYFGLLSAPELFPPPRVTGLAGEGGTQSEVAQRSAPRRPMPRKRGAAGIAPTVPR